MMAAGFFSVASLTLGQFALLGGPKYAGIQQAAREGRENGFLLGVASGVLGYARQEAVNEFNPWNRAMGDDSASQAKIDAFNKAFAEGHNVGSDLTLEARSAYEVCVLQKAAEIGIGTRATSGDEASRELVFVLERAAKEGTAEACLAQASAVVAGDQPSQASISATDDYQVAPQATTQISTCDLGRHCGGG